MTKVGAKDELFGAQTLRAIGSTAYGGADVGECLATLARVRSGDLNSWHDEWHATATRVLRLADAAAQAGDAETARLAYLRASTYFRTAGIMLMDVPTDARLIQSNRHQTDAFRRGATLLPTPPEILEIPYARTTLPGYLFRAHHEPGPLVVLFGGYDSTAEELYFFNGAAALARGYHVLAVDGPGQGAALLQRGLLLRPDWEQVVTPVLDFAVNQPGVDSRRMALIGAGLGGHLAPRAASAEHRLAACVADGGSYDMFAAALARLPGRLASGYLDASPTAIAILRRVLSMVQRQPTAGWEIRRGMLVHGAADPLEYLDLLREYRLQGHAERIECPTLVCMAEGDPISASAPSLFDALTCEKELITFTVAQGAGDHCETGARTLFHARCFGWLDRILQPRKAMAGAG